MFAGFLVFECCVGIFWPSLGQMRGKYVPDDRKSMLKPFSMSPSITTPTQFCKKKETQKFLIFNKSQEK